MANPRKTLLLGYIASFEKDKAILALASGHAFPLIGKTFKFEARADRSWESTTFFGIIGYANETCYGLSFTKDFDRDSVRHHSIPEGLLAGAQMIPSGEFDLALTEAKARITALPD